MQPNSRAPSVAPVVGQRVTSVEFVQDYVQLRFESATMTLLTWPLVLAGDATSRFGESEYEHRLRGLIGQTLESGQVVPGDRLVLVFGAAVRLLVPLDSAAYEGRAEAALLHTKSDGWWVV